MLAIFGTIILLMTMMPGLPIEVVHEAIMFGSHKMPGDVPMGVIARVRLPASGWTIATDPTRKRVRFHQADRYLLCSHAHPGVARLAAHRLRAWNPRSSDHCKTTSSAP
jgi:hypothetical protein